MSSPPVLSGSSFRLPDGTDVEVVIVRLEDGRVVARTKDELARTEKKPARSTPETPRR